MKTFHARRFALATGLSIAALGAHASTTIAHGGYIASEAPTFLWTELATAANAPIPGATRVLGNHDDSATTAINLGFSFTFFNQTYNQAYISSNGLISFGGSTTNNNNANNYSLGDFMNFSTVPMIAVAWDDWTTTFSGTDGVYYATQGAAGSRTFTVEWRNTKKYDVASNSNSSPVSFEAVLYEGSNSIELRYLDMETGGSLVNPDASRGATATVGIRDVNAYANDRYLQWSHDEPILLNGTSVLLAPIPEPQTAALLLAGLTLVVARVSQRKRAGRTAQPPVA